MKPPRARFWALSGFWLGVVWRTIFRRSFGAMLRSRLGTQPVHASGLEHLPASGAFVFAVNHYYAGSTLDVIGSTLLAAARARPAVDDECAVVIGQRAVPRKRWFSRPLLWIANRVFHRWRRNILRIRTSGEGPTGIAELREWRRRAQSGPTLVFPEGAANRVLGDIRPGAGAWLAGLEIPIIPVAVWWENAQWNVVFGAPVRWAARRKLRDLQLGLAMASLLPESLSPRWQTPLARWRRAHDAESFRRSASAPTSRVDGASGSQEAR